ncbi:MAG TPA: hypothetical protein V6D26_08525 [Stenomitos sp.]
MPTLRNAFDAYLKHLDKTGQKAAIPLFRSALLRFTVPGWGGPDPQGARSTASEIEAALNFLEKLDSKEIGKALIIQENVFKTKDVPKGRKKQCHSYLKAFVNWATENGFTSSVEAKDPLEGYKFYGSRRARAGKPKMKLAPLTNRGVRSTYRLGKVKGDYINERLKKQLTDFDYFSQTTLNCTSEKTRSNHEYYMLAILGWMHRERGISLEELSFETIIPVVQINPEASQYSDYNEYWKKKEKARQEATKKAEETRKNIISFFEWRKQESHDLSSTSKGFILDALICATKFLYNNQSDKKQYRHYEDIPAVNILQVNYKAMRKCSDPPPHYYERALPWQTVVKVFEKLRTESHVTHTYFENGKRKQKDPRSQKAIAGTLQRFLILSFLVLIPPDRQRTIRELELGKTLKHGFFLGDAFTSVEKMDDPSQARFYICFTENDYKTGKIYKDWKGELPNHKFTDGKTWYQYLERWLYKEPKSTPRVQEWTYGMRNFLEPSHNKVFSGRINKKAISREGFASLVKTIFNRFTLVPVTPHTLRHVYNTFIRDIGATDAEKESTANWMHQSKEVADRRYSHQKQAQKLRPGMDLITKINQSFLEEYTDDL